MQQHCPWTASAPADNACTFRFHCLELPASSSRKVGRCVAGWPGISGDDGVLDPMLRHKIAVAAAAHSREVTEFSVKGPVWDQSVTVELPSTRKGLTLVLSSLWIDRHCLFHRHIPVEYFYSFRSQLLPGDVKLLSDNVKWPKYHKTASKTPCLCHKL